MPGQLALDHPQEQEADQLSRQAAHPEPHQQPAAEKGQNPGQEQQVTQVTGQQVLHLDLPERAAESRLSGAQIDQALHAARDAEKVLGERARDTAQVPGWETEADLARRLEHHRQAEQARSLDRDGPQLTLGRD